MKINAQWHNAHKMPKNPTKDEKIAWYFEHDTNCSCREMPEWVRLEIENYKKNEEPVILLPHDPNWTKKFEKEKKLIEGIIGKYITGGINHVGSTAIPGLSAKPIVDIMVGIDSLEKASPAVKLLEKINYSYFPYKRRYMYWFRKPALPNKREFHLNLIPTVNPEFKAKIAFRDYLLSHPEEVKRYEDLKVDLAKKFENDREAYTEAKTEFVKEIVTKALGPAFHFET